ncbi:hypothetical protein BDD12DRAFT_804441 [Trichophaea hybrida]|nr:hypothetical protein BDD12DRAFT_804441 [Trichophaea hybrida]
MADLEISQPPSLSTMLLQIPTELLFLVTDFLEFRDLNSLAQANREYNKLLNSRLYRRAVMSMYEPTEKSIFTLSESWDTTFMWILNREYDPDIISTIGHFLDNGAHIETTFNYQYTNLVVTFLTVAISTGKVLVA